MRIETTLRIAPDHPAFAGHFPGTPVLPGVWLLDAVIHAWQQGEISIDETRAQVMHVNAAKFLSPVGLGEVLTILLETSDGRAHFEISNSGRKVASGSLAKDVAR